jgi:hypothetical protein
MRINESYPFLQDNRLFLRGSRKPHREGFIGRTCLRLLLKTVLVGSPQISLRAGVTKYDLHFTS